MAAIGIANRNPFLLPRELKTLMEPPLRLMSCHNLVSSFGRPNSTRVSCQSNASRMASGTAPTALSPECPRSVPAQNQFPHRDYKNAAKVLRPPWDENQPSHFSP